MKKIILILLLLLSGFLASASGQTDSAKYSVPFEQVRSTHCNLIIIRATLNGYAGNFLVDCGSEITVLNQIMAPVYKFKVGMPMADGNSDWSGNSVNVYQVQKANLVIGNTEVNAGMETADISPLLTTIIERTGMQIIGIIGSDVLRANHLVVDYSTKTLHN